MFGPLFDNTFVTLTNRQIIRDSPVHFYMMYYDENIFPQYGIYHNFMTFIRLNPPSVYFESNGFRLITSVPDFEYIGVLTPSFERKSNLTIPEIINKVKKSKEDLIPLYSDNSDLLRQATQHHGKKFQIIWEWVLQNCSIKRKTCKAFFSNLWILKREKFCEYLQFAKNVMNLLDNAPPNLQSLLKSNSNYTGKLTSQVLLERTGYPYYTFHPFIMERIIVIWTSTQLK
jgi:hypothetical protein